MLWECGRHGPPIRRRIPRRLEIDESNGGRNREEGWKVLFPGKQLIVNDPEGKRDDVRWCRRTNASLWFPTFDWRHRMRGNKPIFIHGRDERQAIMVHLNDARGSVYKVEGGEPQKAYLPSAVLAGGSFPVPFWGVVCGCHMLI